MLFFIKLYLFTFASLSLSSACAVSGEDAVVIVASRNVTVEAVNTFILHDW